MLGKPDEVASLAMSLGLHLGASAGYRKAVFEHFGPVLEAYAYEDLVLGFRARLLGEMKYLDTPLVRYRVHTGMTRKEKPLESSVRNQRRVRALKMMRAVFRQRMADYRRLERAEPVVLGAMAARLRDAESRLAYHETPGELFSRRRPGSVVEALKAVYGEARLELVSGLKAHARALLHGRSRG